MLSTALRLPAGDEPAVSRKWRQIVDLVAQQHHADGDAGALGDAVRFLRTAREKVPTATRAEVARSLAGRRVSPFLLVAFADDTPDVMASLLRDARLEAESWLEILPLLSPAARGLLAQREDLPGEVRAALRGFAAVDRLALPAPAAAAEPTARPAPVIAPPSTPPALGAADHAGPAFPRITELLARAERLSEGRAAADRPAAASAPASESGDEAAFRWTAGRDGAIDFVDAVARGALVGLSLAEAETGAEFGVDGHAAGAFRRRTAFRDARLRVPGRSAAAGDWRISARPLFDENDGRFTGYAGTATRPRLDQVAPPAADAAAGTARADGLFGSPIPPDGLRQLVHELRTPLNAIVGFSEMIEGQHLGPADRAQRARAALIRAQAGRLIGAIEDLDTAARLHRGQVAGGHDAVDLHPMLRDLHRRYAGLASERGARLQLDAASAPSAVAGEAADVERMIGRLLAAVVGIIGYGEELWVTLADGDAERVRLEVGRPALIEDVEERELLDPGYAPDGASPAAPLLGLGFALRLIRNLALALGGRFEVEERHLVLTLPRAGVAREATG